MEVYLADMQYSFTHFKCSVYAWSTATQTWNVNFVKPKINKKLMMKEENNLNMITVQCVQKLRVQVVYDNADILSLMSLCPLCLS